MSSSSGGSELSGFVAGLSFALDPFQRIACEAVEDGEGVLVAAPTGAGKTIVGEFAIHLALARGHKAFYTTPIKALSNQKFADLVARHGAASVGLLTGDTSINSDAPVVVMTTEVLRNMLYAGSPALAGLGFVVLDEVHYLADRDRGAVWEEVILHLDQQVQVISLSATVSNAEEFGEWLTAVRGQTAVIVSERRPVPLNQHVAVRDRLLELYAPGSPDAEPRVNPDLVAALRTRPGFGNPAGRPSGHGRGRGVPSRFSRGAGGGQSGGNHNGTGQRGPDLRPSRPRLVTALRDADLLPAIVFVFSRVGCDAAVSQLLAAGVRLTTPAQEALIRAEVEQRCSVLAPGDLAVLGYWSFLDATSAGIAAHHAGMLPLFKQIVEDLVIRGLVRVVVATETLALGINVPARSVVLEKLVKWDGSSHQQLTPGEYTQLTGRAGRRGIDDEGHAIVLATGDLDPAALAGLASRRLYPLKSSFRPTANMTVNLVAQVGRERTRDVLEQSFAQFQADRSVVGLAREARAQREAMAGYAEAATCHLGSTEEYADIAERLTAAERGTSPAHDTGSAPWLPTVGTVLWLAGRRRHRAVLVTSVASTGFGEQQVHIIDDHADTNTLDRDGMRRAIDSGQRMKVPQQPSAAGQRRRVAAALRGMTPPATPRGQHEAREASISELRAALRAHPVHGCAERDDHLRWEQRRRTLQADNTTLTARINGRAGSIAAVFDRVCELLSELGYLDASGTTVLPDGQWLRRIYTENDLLLAECLRRGLWDELDPPGLAALVSSVVYTARRDENESPALPGGPGGAIARAVDATVRAWSDLDDLHVARRLPPPSAPDTGIAVAMHRWTAGRDLSHVLRGTDIAAGDFVRWTSQVIDVLDQIAGSAPTSRLRRTAATALTAIRRGIFTAVQS